jgi:hypothetical protein
MRKLDIGTEKYTVVFAVDSVEFNSNHQYEVKTTEAGDELLHIKFQKGPIKECGVNGVMNEDLIAIVIDRLQGFQASPFSCRENALAITKLEEALHWLRHRTIAREKRGVEGTHVI